MSQHQVLPVLASSGPSCGADKVETLLEAEAMPSPRRGAMIATPWAPNSLSISIAASACMFVVIEGSLEVKIPTTRTDEMQRWEESGKRREEERRSEKRKRKKKEDAGARKGRKVAKQCFSMFFQCFVAPEGRRVGSLKRRVRSHLSR